MYINEFQDAKEITKRDTINTFPQGIQRKVICNQKLWFKENQEALNPHESQVRFPRTQNFYHLASSQKERTQGAQAQLWPQSSCAVTSIGTPWSKLPVTSRARRMLQLVQLWGGSSSCRVQGRHQLTWLRVLVSTTWGLVEPGGTPGDSRDARYLAKPTPYVKKARAYICIAREGSWECWHDCKLALA